MHETGPALTTQLNKASCQDQEEKGIWIVGYALISQPYISMGLGRYTSMASGLITDLQKLMQVGTAIYSGS